MKGLYNRLLCPKCGSNKIETWRAGGYNKARCLVCLWHGLLKSLKMEADSDSQRM